MADTRLTISPTVPLSEPDSMPKAWRWAVLAVLFLATFLNYFDRQTLGTAIEPIASEFGLQSDQRGKLLAAFLFSYGLAHLLIGIITDRVRNLRLFFPLLVAGWSVTTVLTGLAKNFEQLLALRYVLGVFEAVNFPLCILIISKLFPPKERTLASGIFSSGAFLATLVAPKAVIWFSEHYTWRTSFTFAGILGIVWIVAWLAVFRKSVSEACKPVRRLENTLNVKQMGTILIRPAFWGVALMGVGIIPSLYFVTQWLPSFFTQSLHTAYDQSLGNRLLLVYLMLDIGLWVGGAAVLKLSASGNSILRARRTVIIVAFLLLSCVILVPHFQSVQAKVLLFCLFTFGIGGLLGNQHAFKQEVDRSQVATVAAWVGCIEMLFTAFVIRQVGFITAQTSDFSPVFLLLAAFALFGVSMTFILLRKKWLVF